MYYQVVIPFNLPIVLPSGDTIQLTNCTTKWWYHSTTPLYYQVAVPFSEIGHKLKYRYNYTLLFTTISAYIQDNSNFIPALGGR